jgi:hypothetical protein
MTIQLKKTSIPDESRTQNYRFPAEFKKRRLLPLDAETEHSESPDALAESGAEADESHASDKPLLIAQAETTSTLGLVAPSEEVVATTTASSPAPGSFSLTQLAAFSVAGAVGVAIATPDKDRTPPALSTLRLTTDTGSSDSDRITSDATPTTEFTAESGATLAIDWGDGNGFVAAGTATGAAQTLTRATPYASDGSKTVTLRATDAAGNVTTQTLEISIDTQAAVAMTLPADTDLSATQLSSAALAGAADGIEDGRPIAVTFSDGSASVVATAAIASGTWSVSGVDLSALADGPIAVNLSATDEAGNNASATSLAFLTLDRVAPSLTPLTLETDTGISSSDRLSSDLTPTISFAAEAGNLLAIDWGDGQGFQAAGIGSGSAQALVGATQYAADGTKTVAVRATDVAGNVTLQAMDWTLDTHAAISIDLPADTRLTASELAAVTLTGSVDGIENGEPVTITLTDHTNTIVARVFVESGTWTSPELDLSALLDGPIDVSISARDRASNAAEADGANLLILDRVAPQITGLTLESDTGASSTDRITNNASATISFAAEAGTQIVIDWGEGNGPHAYGDADGLTQQFTIDEPYLTDGTKNIQVRATDAAGNTTQQTLQVELDRVASAPSIQLLSGAVVANHGDAPTSFAVQINGNGLIQDLDQIVAEINGHPNYQGYDFPVAAWLWVMDNGYHWDPYTGLSWQHSPAVYMNSMGFGYCDDVTAVYSLIMDHAGYQTRAWDIQGHVMPEVRVGDHWQIYDPDLRALYVDASGNLMGYNDVIEYQADYSFVDTLSSSPYGQVFESFGMPKASHAYSDVVLDLYQDNNNYSFNYATFNPALPTDLLFELPPDSTISFAQGVEPLKSLYNTNVPRYGIVTVDFDAVQNFEFTTPLVPYDVSGNGTVTIGATTYAIGSPQLDNLLAGRSSYIDRMTVTTTGDGNSISYLLNGTRFDLAHLQSFTVDGDPAYAGMDVEPLLDKTVPDDAWTLHLTQTGSQYALYYVDVAGNVSSLSNSVYFLETIV